MLSGPVWAGVLLINHFEISCSLLSQGGTLAGLSVAIRPPKYGKGCGCGPTLPPAIEAIGAMTGLRQLSLSYEEMMAPSLAAPIPGVSIEAGNSSALDMHLSLGTLAPLSSLSSLESFRQAILQVASEE